MRLLFFLFLIFSILFSLTSLQDSYALSVDKNYGVSTEQFGSDHNILGTQIEIEISDIFLNDDECSQNVVSVATQWALMI